MLSKYKNYFFCGFPKDTEKDKSTRHTEQKRERNIKIQKKTNKEKGKLRKRERIKISR